MHSLEKTAGASVVEQAAAAAEAIKSHAEKLNKSSTEEDTDGPNLGELDSWKGGFYWLVDWLIAIARYEVTGLRCRWSTANLSAG